ncbi:hypothetical protein BT63DRAFT_226626 [Microthyrium microscopicum]|uniref:Uncharacterized protein n=1 Tax=Microthyrium microscopicum TaxID=703497 RepID=A0A6A6UDQ6_9PEZI|nr:hypothetical protein BT63DRAFT_226626 [Microthyrium microscopicum]
MRKSIDPDCRDEMGGDQVQEWRIEGLLIVLSFFQILTRSCLPSPNFPSHSFPTNPSSRESTRPPADPTFGIPSLSLNTIDIYNF